MSETHVRRPNRRRIRGLAEAVNELCSASGKRRYIDERGAQRAMAEVAGEDPAADRLNTYRCVSCSDFHFGHRSVSDE